MPVLEIRRQNFLMNYLDRDLDLVVVEETQSGDVNIKKEFDFA